MRDLNEMTREQLIRVAESQRLAIAQLKKSVDRLAAQTMVYQGAAEQHWHEEESKRGQQGIFG